MSVVSMLTHSTVFISEIIMTENLRAEKENRKALTGLTSLNVLFTRNQTSFTIEEIKV